MADIPKNFTDATIKLIDGTTPTALEKTAAFTAGDFSTDGLVADGREVTAYTSKGVLIGLRLTNPVFWTFSFTATLSEFTKSTGGNLQDFVLKNGPHASGGGSPVVSTSTDIGDVTTFTVEITLEGTDVGDSSDHVMTATRAHVTVGWSEGDPDTLTISGTVYGGLPTFT